MMNQPLLVGRVLRSSNSGFAVGCRVLREDVPEFGAFVKVVQGAAEIVGLICDVQFVDDPLVRQIITAEAVEPELRLDQSQRLAPIEVRVLVVGYSRGGQIFQHLPAQPPATLNEIVTCTADEVAAFTREFTFLRTIINNKDIPADELAAASLRAGASARVPDDRRAFLLDAGRELARILCADLVRLEGILRRLRPARAL